MGSLIYWSKPGLAKLSKYSILFVVGCWIQILKFPIIIKFISFELSNTEFNSCINIDLLNMNEGNKQLLVQEIGQVQGQCLSTISAAVQVTSHISPCKWSLKTITTPELYKSLHSQTFYSHLNYICISQNCIFIQTTVCNVF